MSRRRRAGLPARWIVRRSASGPPGAPATTCASCGRTTADTVLGDSLSVVALDGGRRLAPPMPLCEACRRDVIYRRGWLPTWCGPCQSWRPFGHDHDERVAIAAVEVTV